MITQPPPLEIWDRASKLAEAEGLSYSAAWHRIYDDWKRLSVHEHYSAGLATDKRFESIASSLGFASSIAAVGPLLAPPYYPVPLKTLAGALANQQNYHPLAAYLSVRAAMAYEKTADIEQHVAQERGENLRHFKGGTTAGFGYTRAGHAFLSFRGTRIKHPEDWVVDFSFLPLPWPWPLRHLGFYCAWSWVRKEVIEWVNKLPNDTRHLVLTGHSLGGAIAVLAAFELAERFHVRAVITFGQPRVGLFLFTHYYDTQPCGPDEGETLHAITHRYIHATDLFPRLPPPILYCHMGNQWQVDDQGNCEQTSPQKLITRMGESYNDLRLKITTLPQRLVAAQQQRPRIIDQEQFRRRASQMFGSETQNQPAPKTASSRPNGLSVLLTGQSWQAFQSRLFWVVTSPVQVLSALAAILFTLIVWSYSRDALSHPIVKYLKPFHKSYPDFIPRGDLERVTGSKRSSSVS
jgi:pimeloyl-ACP methyl ester carboxylesterase